MLSLYPPRWLSELDCAPIDPLKSTTRRIFEQILAVEEEHADDLADARAREPNQLRRGGIVVLDEYGDAPQWRQPVGGGKLAVAGICFGQSIRVDRRNGIEPQIANRRLIGVGQVHRHLRAIANRKIQADRFHESKSARRFSQRSRDLACDLRVARDEVDVISDQKSARSDHRSGD